LLSGCLLSCLSVERHEINESKETLDVPAFEHRLAVMVRSVMALLNLREERPEKSPLR
jgi:hypothetical protein